jgi:hypothetical protein
MAMLNNQMVWFVKTACDKECAVFKIIMSIIPCAEPVDGDTTGSVALSTLPTPNAQVQFESWHQSTKVCQVCAIVSVLGRAPLLSAKNIKEFEDSQPRRALNSPWPSSPCHEEKWLGKRRMMGPAWRMFFKGVETDGIGYSWHLFFWSSFVS